MFLKPTVCNTNKSACTTSPRTLYYKWKKLAPVATYKLKPVADTPPRCLRGEPRVQQSTASLPFVLASIALAFVPMPLGQIVIMAATRIVARVCVVLVVVVVTVPSVLVLVQHTLAVGWHSTAGKLSIKIGAAAKTILAKRHQWE